MEAVAAHGHGELHLLELRRGHEHRQEAAHHQVVDVALRAGEGVEVRLLLGGDDGVVVGDLVVVDDVFGLQRAVAHDALGQLFVGRHHNRADAVGESGDHVVRDVAAVGAGVGEGLVVLVERLHQVQGLLGAVGELLVGVALELGEVVSRRGRGLAAHAAHLGDDGVLALALPDDLLHGLPVKAAGDALGVLIFGAEAVEVNGGAVELLGHEALDLVLPGHDQGQGGGLDAARRELGVEFAGQGAGDVQAHQPVGLGPGLGGAEKIVVFCRRTQVGEALLNGPVGLGRDPEAPGRLLPAGLDHDPAGHQLALAACVGGDDQVGDVAPLHEALDDLVLFSRFADDHQLHMLRKHGQILHVPFFQLLVIDIGVRQGDQVPQGPGDHIAVALHVALAASAAAQHPGQLLADGGLFRQDQRLCHDPASLFVFLYYSENPREINRSIISGIIEKSTEAGEKRAHVGMRPYGCGVC